MTSYGLSSLIKQLQSQTATAYFGLPSRTPLLNSDLLYYLCCYYEDHYSRWNLFLPKAFRQQMHNRNGFTGESPLFQLLVFHYAIKFSSLKKAETLRKIYLNQHQELADLDKVLSFMEQHQPLSVLDFRFTGVGKRFDVFLPAIVGNKTLIQQAVDYLKYQPRQVWEFLNSMTDFQQDVTWVKDQTKQAHLYDLVQKPKYCLLEERC